MHRLFAVARETNQQARRLPGGQASIHQEELQMTAKSTKARFKQVFLAEIETRLNSVVNLLAVNDMADSIDTMLRVYGSAEARRILKSMVIKADFKLDNGPWFKVVLK
jgi:hypothetical protein